MRRAEITRQLELALQRELDAPRLRVTALTDQQATAIDAVHEPWFPIKYGPASPDDWFGVVPALACFERAPGAAAEELPLIVKVNPQRALARGLIPWIVAQQHIALDRPYSAFRTAAELDHTVARETQLYALARTTPQLAQVLPRCWGSAADPTTGEHVLFLEHVTDAAHLDPHGAETEWPPDLIAAALAAAAGWQSAFWDIAADDIGSTIPSSGPRPTTSDMVADTPLWRTLVDDGRKRFPDIVTEHAWRRRHDIIATLADWHPAKDRLPATLAHNDFNQRNIGFRPALLALDWELTQHNTAHRDAVELLTFVLPAAAGRDEVDALLEGHRAALAARGVTAGIDREEWMEGFRCELKVEAINRIGLQLLFAAQFPLPYLARINANIERLIDMYE
jgi:hydroxymethylglutaryl-CoA reductase (NADPH)